MNFPDFHVHQVKIKADPFPHQHLDCVMVMFSTWGLAVAEDLEGGLEALPAKAREKKWIPMKRDEAIDKLGNFIALNPEEVIMAEEAGRIADEVEKLGIKVHRPPYCDVGKVGGSFRCNTCPIFRA